MAFTLVNTIPMADGRSLLTYEDTASGVDKVWDFDTDAPAKCYSAELMSARLDIDALGTGATRYPILQVRHSSLDLIVSAVIGNSSTIGIDDTDTKNINYLPASANAAGVTPLGVGDQEHTVSIAPRMFIGAGDSYRVAVAPLVASDTMDAYLTIACMIAV